MIPSGRYAIPYFEAVKSLNAAPDHRTRQLNNAALGQLCGISRSDVVTRGDARARAPRDEVAEALTEGCGAVPYTLTH